MDTWCQRCRGRRIVGAKGPEEQRAAAAEIGHPDIPEADCPLCEGAFADAAKWLDAAQAALKGFEYSTFQMGALFPIELEKAEKAHVVEDGPQDTMRTEANRWLAPQLEALTGATLDLGEPEVVVVVDTRFWHASVNPRSMYVKGRYTKHRRDIPQTHWPCRRCQGPGCWECNGVGILYADSVEDAIGVHMAPAFGGSKYAFHGAGREDIDALMLGTGRPFVLEVKDPVKRSADLEAVAAAVNATTATSGVGVLDLHIVHKSEVAKIKDGAYDKQYLARCVAEADVTEAQVVAAAAAIEGETLQQQTPQRVAHRRADLVRPRIVHRLRMTEFTDARHFTLQVHAESGAYIKELVHGDEGRTTPNFSAVLGVPCVVEMLDVCAIMDDEPDPAADVAASDVSVPDAPAAT